MSWEYHQLLPLALVTGMVINIADILRVLPLAWRLSDKDWRIDRVFSGGVGGSFCLSSMAHYPESGDSGQDNDMTGRH